MSDPNSVTQLMQQLEAGDSVAAIKIWERFIQRLIRLAQRRLQNLPRRSVDEEDVAISAFNAFFQGVKERRFEHLNDREDLWQVLAMLAERKAIGVLRRELADKRGGGVNRGESVFERMIRESSAAHGIEAVADPSPDIVDGFANGVRDMLEALSDETAQTIALLKLQGLTNKEIAMNVGISLRAVERKLGMIRQKWAFA